MGISSATPYLPRYGYGHGKEPNTVGAHVPPKRQFYPYPYPYPYLTMP